MLASIRLSGLCLGKRDELLFLRLEFNFNQRLSLIFRLVLSRAKLNMITTIMTYLPANIQSYGDQTPGKVPTPQTNHPSGRRTSPTTPLDEVSYCCARPWLLWWLSRVSGC